MEVFADCIKLCSLASWWRILLGSSSVRDSQRTWSFGDSAVLGCRGAALVYILGNWLWDPCVCVGNSVHSRSSAQYYCWRKREWSGVMLLETPLLPVSSEACPVTVCNLAHNCCNLCSTMLVGFFVLFLFFLCVCGVIKYVIISIIIS